MELFNTVKSTYLLIFSVPQPFPLNIENNISIKIFSINERYNLKPVWCALSHASVFHYMIHLCAKSPQWNNRQDALVVKVAKSIG